MMNTKKINNHYSVSEHFSIEQIETLSAQGFKTIINCRPDGETGDQPTSDEIQQKTESLGMQYFHVPMIPGQISAEAMNGFADAYGAASKPTLGFCRTGKRAAMLWAVTEASDRSSASIIADARLAGFDLTPMAVILDKLYSQ